MMPLPDALVDKLIGACIDAKNALAEMSDEYDWFDERYGDDLNRLWKVLEEIAEESKPGSGDTTG